MADTLTAASLLVKINAVKAEIQETQQMHQRALTASQTAAQRILHLQGRQAQLEELLPDFEEAKRDG